MAQNNDSPKISSSNQRLQEIADFLDREVIPNGWDAHFGSGAGDDAVRIPSREVKEFQSFIRLIQKLPRMIELCCKYPDILSNCDRCEYCPKSGVRKGCCNFGTDDIVRMIRDGAK